MCATALETSGPTECIFGAADASDAGRKERAAVFSRRAFLQAGAVLSAVMLGDMALRSTAQGNSPRQVHEDAHGDLHDDWHEDWHFGYLNHLDDTYVDTRSAMSHFRTARRTALPSQSRSARAGAVDQMRHDQVCGLPR